MKALLSYMSTCIKPEFKKKKKKRGIFPGFENKLIDPQRALLILLKELSNAELTGSFLHRVMHQSIAGLPAENQSRHGDN